MRSEYRLIKQSMEIKFHGKIPNYIIILLVYLISNFITATNISGQSAFPFFDLYFWQMGYGQHVLFHGIFIIFFIHKIIEDQQYNIYLCCKYRNRNCLFKHKIFMIFFSNLCYMLLTFIICLFQCINKNFYDIKWNNFSVRYFKLVRNYNPSNNLVNYIGPFLINMFFFLLALSLLYFFLTLIISKKQIAILILILIEIVNYSIYLNRLAGISKYTFWGNLILGYHESKLNIAVNWSFWLPTIVMLIVLCYIIYQRKDLTRYSK